MQFRAQGRRIRILEYQGYDRSRRRSIVRLIGTLDRYHPRITSDLAERLTAEQRAEVEAWIQQRTEDETRRRLEREAAYLDRSIREAVEAIDREAHDPSPEWAATVYSAIDELTRALRRRGLTRRAVQGSVDGQ